MPYLKASLPVSPNTECNGKSVVLSFRPCFPVAPEITDH